MFSYFFQASIFWTSLVATFLDSSRYYLVSSRATVQLLWMKPCWDNHDPDDWGPSQIVLVIVTAVTQVLVLLTWMRHLASTSCSLVWASSSSKCLSCSFSPSFSSSSGSVDVLSLLGDNGCRDPRVLNRSLQWSQPITLLCMSTETHVLVEGGDGVYMLYTTERLSQVKNTHSRSVLWCYKFMLLWTHIWSVSLDDKHKVIQCLMCASVLSLLKPFPVVLQWFTRLTCCTWKSISTQMHFSLFLYYVPV